MHSLRTWRSALHIAVTGMYFGALQWGAFFLLQSYLASTALVYLLATAAWMVGSLVGLALPGRSREILWLFASAAGYAVLHLLATAHPYEMRWLPALLACIAVMGGYAGRFFRYRAQPDVGSDGLFLIENTGFVAGMLLTVVLLYTVGDRTLVAGPAVGAVLCALSLAVCPNHPRPSPSPEPQAATPVPHARRPPAASAATSAARSAAIS